MPLKDESSYYIDTNTTHPAQILIAKASKTQKELELDRHHDKGAYKAKRAVGKATLPLTNFQFWIPETA